MKKFYWLVLLIIVSGCIRKNVNGIIIGHNLYDTQSISFNHTLCSLIEKTLQGDPQSLKKIISIWDGGASGSYDKGDVIVQILDRIGEKDFIKMALTLNQNDRSSLKYYLEVGIEYGRLTNLKNMEVEYPQLSAVLSN